MRSKTDNLDRLIAEVDRDSAAAAAARAGRSGSSGAMAGLAGSHSGSSVGGNGNGGAPGREVKRYIRRRYTDSRHPTTELPDVRDEMPSVQGPPVRKDKSKTNLNPHGKC